MEVCKTSHTGSNPVLASTGEGYWWYRLALAGKVVQFHKLRSSLMVKHWIHKPKSDSSILGSIPSPATKMVFEALR
jgi:hypothetical protein